MTDVKMTKEEAIKFAKKYLADRKKNYVNNKFGSERAWNIAVEYVLLDIIPFIYGEALD